MENQEKRYIFDIPINCERGHLLEKIGMTKESQAKTSQEKTWRFALTAFCEKCDKLIGFNLVIAVTKKNPSARFLPRIKGLPVDRHRQTKKISR